MTILEMNTVVDVTFAAVMCAFWRSLNVFISKATGFTPRLRLTTYLGPQLAMETGNEPLGRRIEQSE